MSARDGRLLRHTPRQAAPLAVQKSGLRTAMQFTGAHQLRTEGRDNSQDCSTRKVIACTGSLYQEECHKDMDLHYTPVSNNHNHFRDLRRGDVVSASRISTASLSRRVVGRVYGIFYTSAPQVGRRHSGISFIEYDISRHGDRQHRLRLRFLKRKKKQHIC